MATLVYLGLGSNHNREHNLQWALDFLAALLTGLRCSPVYASAPVGAAGPDFYNLVVRGYTDLSLLQLNGVLKRFEARQQRQRQPQLVMPIDIDVLLFGRQVGVFDGIRLPRCDVLEQPYVMRPLAALDPGATHPQNGQTFRSLWTDSLPHLAPGRCPVPVTGWPALSGFDSAPEVSHDRLMGLNLRQLRLRRGLTQRHLARMADVTPSSISMIEKSSVSPAVGTLSKILSALSVSLPEFFEAVERDIPL